MRELYFNRPSSKTSPHHLSKPSLNSFLKVRNQHNQITATLITAIGSVDTKSRWFGEPLIKNQRPTRDIIKKDHGAGLHKRLQQLLLKASLARCHRTGVLINKWCYCYLSRWKGLSALLVLVVMAMVADHSAVEAAGVCNPNALYACMSAVQGARPPSPSKQCWNVVRSLDKNCMCNQLKSASFPAQMVNNGLQLPKKCGRTDLCGFKCGRYTFPY